MILGGLSYHLGTSPSESIGYLRFLHTYVVIVHYLIEPLQQHTADSGSGARFSLAQQQFLHYNSLFDLATLPPNHLGEPDTPYTDSAPF